MDERGRQQTAFCFLKYLQKCNNFGKFVNLLGPSVWTTSYEGLVINLVSLAMDQEANSFPQKLILFKGTKHSIISYTLSFERPVHPLRCIQLLRLNEQLTF